MNGANVQPMQIGDVVYVARAYGYASKRVPCPVCYGKLFVTLILGDGEHVVVECDGCGLGYDGPQGFITEHGTSSSVTTATVRGIERDGNEWRIITGGGTYEAWFLSVFPTHEQAEARRLVLLAEVERAATETNDRVAASKRKHVGWLVRYHREQLARAERDVAHHNRKLSDALARRRQKPATPAPSSRAAVPSTGEPGR